MMGPVRKSKGKARGSGFVVTWDVDGRVRLATGRLWSFLFGRRVKVGLREDRYEGVVWREGVRYIGQSVVFVLPHRLAELTSFLNANKVDHEIDTHVFP